MSLSLKQMVEDAAREVRGYLEGAAADLGMNADYVSMYDADSEQARKIEEWKQMGLSKMEIQEALADWTHDDEDSTYDLAGDRIYDEAYEIIRKRNLANEMHKGIFKMICEELISSSFGSQKKAFEKLLANH